MMVSYSPLLGETDVEVIGLKGERLASSSIGFEDTVYLATRDEHRITIQGYHSAEDAEQARADLRPDVESQVRAVGARLPWLEEMAEAGPGKTRKWEP